MMSVFPWVLIDSESSWIWLLMTSSIHFHNNQVLVPPSKPPDPMKYIYDGRTYLKTRVDIWARMDVVPVEYGIDYLQVGLFDVVYHFSTGLDWSLDQIENL